MTDREKIIVALENCADFVKCRDCPWDECDNMEHDVVNGVPRNLLLGVLELLKTQESVEPLLALNDGEHKLWQCGNCKVAVFTRDSKYCHNCGRAVKWDE